MPMPHAARDIHRIREGLLALRAEAMESETRALESVAKAQVDADNAAEEVAWADAALAEIDAQTAGMEVQATVVLGGRHRRRHLRSVGTWAPIAALAAWTAKATLSQKAAAVALVGTPVTVTAAVLGPPAPHHRPAAKPPPAISHTWAPPPGRTPPVDATRSPTPSPTPTAASTKEPEPTPTASLKPTPTETAPIASPRPTAPPVEAAPIREPTPPVAVDTPGPERSPEGPVTPAPQSPAVPVEEATESATAPSPSCVLDLRPIAGVGLLCPPG